MNTAMMNCCWGTLLKSQSCGYDSVSSVLKTVLHNITDTANIFQTHAQLTVRFSLSMQQLIVNGDVYSPRNTM